jgi:hypothetical protein
MSTTEIPENHEPAPLLGLGSSEVLGPNAPLLERLRSTAHWQLTEGNGDDATHQALQEAIAGLEHLRSTSEALIYAYRAKYARPARGDMRRDAPLLNEVTALNAALAGLGA